MTRLGMILLLALSFSLSGCSTSKKEQLSDVKRGMSKAEVLAIAGNPSRSSRSAGADRWSYDVKDDRKRRVETIDVYFTGGQVQYVGSETAFQKQVEAQEAQKKTDDSEFRDL